MLGGARRSKLKLLYFKARTASSSSLSAFDKNLENRSLLAFAPLSRTPSGIPSRVQLRETRGEGKRYEEEDVGEVKRQSSLLNSLPSSST